MISFVELIDELIEQFSPRLLKKMYGTQMFRISDDLCIHHMLCLVRVRLHYTSKLYDGIRIRLI